MIKIAPLYNSDRGAQGRLSGNERVRIMGSAAQAAELGYLQDGDTVYPRVENGEIAIYFQPFCKDFYAKGDARGAAGAGYDGNLLDPWDHIDRRSDIFPEVQESLLNATNQ